MQSGEGKPQRRITLKPIQNCTLEQQMEVREVRNQSGVRSSMYTDHVIPLDEHLNWVFGLENDKRQIVFAVLDEAERPIGVVSVNAIDRLHRKADWAFYLDENERGGLGAALEYSLLEFAFNKLGLEKLNCEVVETNAAVVKMHKKFAFTEEGYRRSNIEKNGSRVGVFFLGITKSDWNLSRGSVFSKYESVLSKFLIILDCELADSVSRCS